MPFSAVSVLGPTGMFCQAALLTIIPFRRALRRWPSLFTWSAINLATSVILMVTYGSKRLYPVYFVTYYGASVLLAVVRLWIVADVARSFRDLDFLPKHFEAFLGVVALSAGAGSAIYAYSMAARNPGFTTLVYVSGSMDVAWLTFALVLVAATRLFNFEWNPLGAKVAAGIVLQILIAGLTTLVSPTLPNSRLHAYIANSLCYILVMSYLVFTFVRTPNPSLARREQTQGTNSLTNRVPRES